MPSILATAAPMPSPEATLLVVGEPSLPMSALARPDVKALIARTADEALAVLQADDVALIVLAESTPMAVAERLRASEPACRVPMLFLRAAGAGESLPPFAGDEAAPVDVARTPVDARLLCHKITVFVERHRQHLALRDQAAALQRAMIFNDTMVSVLVHDLRSPLTAISASAELMRRIATDDLPRQAGERIQRGAQRITQTLVQLLDFAQIRSGNLRLDRAPGDLGDVLARAMAEVRQARPSARIDHHAEGDLAGHFDADRLMRVVVHLLSNALLHGEPGQPVRVMLDGSTQAELSVRVTNIGQLPPDRQPSAFNAAPAPSPGSTRLGLGLYVVEQLVQAHHGRVAGRSMADGSTVFEFSIPRAG